MTLSKKHYIAIANIIEGYSVSEQLIKDLSDYFKSDNSNFDRYTFLKACGVK